MEWIYAGARCDRGTGEIKKRNLSHNIYLFFASRCASLLSVVEKWNKAQLLSELRQRDEEIAQLRAALEQAQAENALLRQKVDLLVRKVFGQSSEKLDPGQLDLFLLASPEVDLGKVDASSLEEARLQPPKKNNRREERSPRCPEDLPVVEEILDPQEIAQAPQDWRMMGQEVSEQLDYQPGRFFRRRLIRRKYVRRDQPQQPPVIAPLPPSLQERCVAAPGLLAAIVVAKYTDHLPLHRQQAIFQTRHGVHLPRQTMARWMGLVADWLRPIYDLIRTGVMAGGYVQVDETPIRYLSPGHGKTKQGYLWTALSPGGDVAYHWHTSRGAECLRKIIPADFSGTLQCDAYAAYACFARGREITLAGCWAHTRRKFYDARGRDSLRALWILRQIGHLYQIESALREIKAGPRLRVAVRAQQSRPILRRIHRALARFKVSGRHLPSSCMGEAIDYALSNWSLLEVFLSDGRLEPDTNLVENAIRPTAVGKKNWLFFGDDTTGQRGAILYTIIESCRRRGINPQAYLHDVLTRLPSMTNWQVSQLTPQAWALSQKTSTLRAAA
jgi:transposase